VSLLARVRPDLLNVRGYSSARMEAGDDGLLLNANESAWASITDPSAALQRYPDGQQPAALVAGLATLYGVAPDSLLAARGSDECIDLLTRAFCRAGRDAVLVSGPTFAMYRVSAELQGARVLDVPLAAGHDFAWDAEAVADAALSEPDLKLVYVCSPNNPTGGLAPPEDVLGLARALHDRALVVVDEAYIEFAQGRSLVADVAATPNLAVLRTLSKAHALAGARIGTLVAAPELVALLRRLMAPYPIATPSARAAVLALAADSVAATRQRSEAIAAERRRVAPALARLPAVQHVSASQANFLCVRFRDAAVAYRALKERGIVARDVSALPGLAQCLRLTLGRPEDNDAVLAVVAALREAA
jgi:histidinol-phosphate aminotransferase